MVKRLVGYWEYFNALLRLDKFSRTLKEGEREQVDKFLRKRSQFSVATNLSERYSRGQRSTLNDPAGAKTQRHGLNWMTALARVELGAMLAGYTKIARPFEMVSPTQEDREAYEYLLFDGIRSHYWALKHDPVAQHLPKSRKLTPVLAYSRRLLMMRGMVSTLSRISTRNWSFPETQEFAKWNSDLDELRGVLTVWVNNYLKTYQQIVRSDSRQTWKEKCQDCLNNLGR